MPKTYRDSEQKNMVCQTLLRSVSRGGNDLWTMEGPTQKASDIHRASLKGGERVLLLLCWMIWNDHKDLGFADLKRLDSSKRQMVERLFVAQSEGPDAIDGWIIDHFPLVDLP